MADNPTLNIMMIFFGVAISSLFIILNIYKPNALIAVAFLYLVLYSIMVLTLLNSYKKAFNDNMHYTIDWYASYFNIILGIAMLLLYYFISSKQS